MDSYIEEMVKASMKNTGNANRQLEALNVPELMGSGIYTRARETLESEARTQALTKNLCEHFNSFGVWAAPKYGKFKGRPGWIDRVQSHQGTLCLELRFPSLRGNNEHIEDRDCIFHVDNVTFVKTENWQDAKGSKPVVRLKIPHFVEEPKAGYMAKTDKISHWTNLEVQMTEFLK